MTTPLNNLEFFGSLLHWKGAVHSSGATLHAVSSEAERQVPGTMPDRSRKRDSPDSHRWTRPGRCSADSTRSHFSWLEHQASGSAYLTKAGPSTCALTGAAR